jgi:DNA (cytosine-5)-methyltransferase 1
VLDAQYFGVPQRRRRVFVVGSLGDYASVEVLLEPESLSGDSPPSREERQEIAGTFGGSSQSGGFRTTDLDNSGAFIFESRIARNDRGGPEMIVPPLKAQSGGTGRGDGAPLVVSRPLAYSRTSDHFDESQQTYVIAGTVTGAEAHNGNSNPIPDNLVVGLPDPAYSIQGQGTRLGSGRHNQDTFIVAATLRSRQSSPGVPKPGRGGEDDENIVLGFSENQRAESRLTDYARQLTGGGGKPGQGYPAALTGGLVRRLTPTECERLQGFPDGWTAGHADSSRYRMLGNAVCVPVAEWIGRRILR